MGSRRAMNAPDRRAALLEPASEDALASLVRVEAALAASCLRATLVGNSGKVHDVAFSAVRISRRPTAPLAYARKLRPEKLMLGPHRRAGSERRRTFRDARNQLSGWYRARLELPHSQLLARHFNTRRPGIIPAHSSLHAVSSSPLVIWDETDSTWASGDVTSVAGG